MASLHSPKNPFRMQIDYDKPIEGIGSVESYTGEKAEWLKSLAADRVRIAGTHALITITENKKTYPQFDWQVVEKYEL